MYELRQITPLWRRFSALTYLRVQRMTCSVLSRPCKQHTTVASTQRETHPMRSHVVTTCHRHTSSEHYAPMYALFTSTLIISLPRHLTFIKGMWHRGLSVSSCMYIYIYIYIYTTFHGALLRLSCTYPVPWCTTTAAKSYWHWLPIPLFLVSC